MDYALSCEDSRRSGSRSIVCGIVLWEFGESWGHASCGDCSHLPAVAGRQKPELRLADTRRSFEYCIEDLREIARRSVDDPQNLVGCSLLLQKLVAFGKA